MGKGSPKSAAAPAAAPPPVMSTGADRANRSIASRKKKRKGYGLDKTIMAGREAVGEYTPLSPQG